MIQEAKPVRRLSRKELAKFRLLLIEKRKSILCDVDGLKSEICGDGYEGNNGTHPDFADDVAGFSTDSYELEVASQLLASEHEMLREIHEALERIEKGTFGICEATGKPITRARLKAIPWARHCIEYAQQTQKRLYR